MKKLISLLLTLPLAWNLAYSQQSTWKNIREKEEFHNAKEIRINSEYIQSFYGGIYNQGKFGPGLVDYTNEAKLNQEKAKEKISDRIFSCYLLTKTGNDTITLDINNLYYTPSYFRAGVYYKGDAAKLIFLRDSLGPKKVVSLVKALVNEKGDTLKLIKRVKD